MLGFNNYAQELKWLVTDDTRVSPSNIIKGLSGSGNTLVLIDRLATGEILNDKIDWVFQVAKLKFPIGKKEYAQISEMDNKVIVATYGVAAVGINIPESLT